MDEHLLLLGSDEDSCSDDDNSSDDDSSVEITSNPDECESELIRLSTYLQLESGADNDDDQTFEWPDPPSSLLSSCSSNDDQSNDSQQMLPPSTSNDNVHAQGNSTKRKRRQWTIKEKIDAVVLFEKNHNKRETAMKKGCTTAQLRNWIKNKENLFKMREQKKGTFPYYLS